MALAPHPSTVSASTPVADRDGAKPNCARCNGDVTRIDMVRNGLELEFVSCSRCDTREWLRNGEPVDLDLLLEEMVAAREAVVVNPAAANSEPSGPIEVADAPLGAVPVASTMDIFAGTDAEFVSDVANRFVA